MRDLFGRLLDQLLQGHDVVLASVIEHTGSTPRSSGSCMLVQRDGSIFGSVGGGLLEAKVQRAAWDLFKAGGGRLVDFDLTGSEAAQEGMLCGGRLRLKLEHLPGGAGSAMHFERLAGMVAQGKKAVLVSQMEGPDAEIRVCSRWVMSRHGFEGQAPPKSVAAALRQRVSVLAGPGIVELEGKRYLVEPFAAGSEAMVVGAGHVGQATARLTAMVGFHTLVLDDRPEFANQERFPEADRVLVLDSFSDCFRHIQPSSRSFVIIMTRGHLHDRVVLAQALATEAAYIGMIGSIRKRAAIYQALREEGVGEGALARVHCPVGLSIKAETPEEIGVSIVAEMIKVRAELLAGEG